MHFLKFEIAKQTKMILKPMINLLGGSGTVRILKHLLKPIIGAPPGVVNKQLAL